jgi:hypothetical protein
MPSLVSHLSSDVQ